MAPLSSWTSSVRSCTNSIMETTLSLTSTVAPGPYGVLASLLPAAASGALKRRDLGKGGIAGISVGSFVSFSLVFLVVYPLLARTVRLSWSNWRSRFILKKKRSRDNSATADDNDFSNESQSGARAASGDDTGVGSEEGNTHSGSTARNRSMDDMDDNDAPDPAAEPSNRTESYDAGPEGLNTRYYDFSVPDTELGLPTDPDFYEPDSFQKSKRYSGEVPKANNGAFANALRWVTSGFTGSGSGYKAIDADSPNTQGVSDEGSPIVERGLTRSPEPRHSHQNSTGNSRSLSFSPNHQDQLLDIGLDQSTLTQDLSMSDPDAAMQEFWDNQRAQQQQLFSDQEASLMAFPSDGLQPGLLEAMGAVDNSLFGGPSSNKNAAMLAAASFHRDTPPQNPGVASTGISTTNTGEVPHVTCSSFPSPISIKGSGLPLPLNREVSDGQAQQSFTDSQYPLLFPPNQPSSEIFNSLTPQVQQQIRIQQQQVLAQHPFNNKFDPNIKLDPNAYQLLGLPTTHIATAPSSSASAAASSSPHNNTLLSPSLTIEHCSPQQNIENNMQSASMYSSHAAVLLPLHPAQNTFGNPLDQGLPRAIGQQTDVDIVLSEHLGHSYNNSNASNPLSSPHMMVPVYTTAMPTSSIPAMNSLPATWSPVNATLAEPTYVATTSMMIPDHSSYTNRVYPNYSTNGHMEMDNGHNSMPRFDWQTQSYIDHTAYPVHNPSPYPDPVGVSRGSLSPPTHHGMSATTYQCTLCSRSFDQQHKLNHHQRYHKKPHKCTIKGCSGAFGTKTHLDRHINDKHSQTRTFHCVESSCAYSRQGGRGFPRKDNWRRHMMNVHQMPANSDLKADMVETAPEMTVSK